MGCKVCGNFVVGMFKNLQLCYFHGILVTGNERRLELLRKQRSAAKKAHDEKKRREQDDGNSQGKEIQANDKA